jgi:Leucine-rich repeat (LRR) protein
MTQLAKQLIAQAKAEGWKRLDLGYCGLTDLETQVPELFDLTDLEELVLSNWWREWDEATQQREQKESQNKGQANRLSQLPQAIAQLKQLKVLVCGGDFRGTWAISDYSIIQYLPHLTYLYLSYNQITRIENLDKLPDLQYLDLSWNGITRIENLAELSNLQQLDLSGNQITRIEHLDKLPNLQRLDLSSNKITRIEHLDKLPNLQQLNLSSNKITRIEHLDKLPNLQQLNLSRNQITRIQNLDKLPNLQQLNLWSNQITRIENLDKLPNLQQLDISSNKITRIEHLDKLPNLQQLYLSENKITRIEHLDKLPNLQRLDLSENKITRIENLDKLPNLQQLGISFNQITRIEHLDKLPNLQQLDLSFNQITRIEHLDKLPNLQQLDLRYNQLTRIEHLDKLPNLQQLNLSRNQITRIENLDKLPNLQQLYLSENKITRIENLDKLPNLQQLDLRRNQITRIENLDKLPNLQRLDLNSNQITRIENLAELTNLQQLDLGDNQISNLSPLLPFLQRAENPFQLVVKDRYQVSMGEINVKDNPLTTPPMGIVKQGTAAVLHCFKDYGKGAAANKEIKLIVVGNGCVGKTASVRRLVHNTYEHIDIATGRTHGIIIEHYTLPDTDGIQLHIWDFGGQEIYHATHRLFLSSNALYLLLWSNEPQDQPHEPHYQPTYWLDYIAELSNKNTVLLVPTKHDLYGNYALPDFTELQSIYNEKGLQLHQLNAISALNGTNIRALRAQLSDLAEQRLQQHTEQLPTNWIAVRQRVYEQWIDTKRKIATLADFAALCKGLDISDEATVLHYLSSSGIVFWQADLLRNDIIIDQQYFLDIIYAVFKDRHVEKYGTFTWEDACHIWQSHKDGHIYSDDDRRLFLRFMQSCEIMFETETEQGETQYIIPQLLPPTPAHTWLNKQDEKQLRLSYPFLHRNIIERFIVRTAPYAQKAKLWWRNGIYLADEQGNEAYIQAPAPDAQQDQREQAIVVKVCGNNALPLLAKICNEFAQLSRFEQVKQEVSLDAGKNFIDIKHIKQQYQRGERHIYTKKNDKVGISPYLAFLDTETTLSSSPPKNNITTTMNHKDHLRQLVAGGKLKQAITELHEATRQNGQSDLYNNITHLSGRFNTNENSQNSGIISHEDHQLELNRISNALLNYIGEYKPNGGAVVVPPHNQSTTNGDNNIIIQGANNSIINLHTK